jgi:hypothetical protein
MIIIKKFSKTIPKYGEVFTCETGEYFSEYSFWKLFCEYSFFFNYYFVTTFAVGDRDLVQGFIIFRKQPRKMWVFNHGTYQCWCRVEPCPH